MICVNKTDGILLGMMLVVVVLIVIVSTVYGTDAKWTIGFICTGSGLLAGLTVGLALHIWQVTLKGRQALGK